MASIAVLPVLIGLAVDYAIQFQARFNEARARGAAPRPRAATAAASSGGPVIGAACLATAAGFAALVLSPIPMVRSFGLLLVLGIGARLRPRGDGRVRGPGARGVARGPRAAARRPLDRLAPEARVRSHAPVRSVGKRALAVAIARPGRVPGRRVVLAVCGWVAEHDDRGRSPTSATSRRPACPRSAT